MSFDISVKKFRQTMGNTRQERIPSLIKIDYLSSVRIRNSFGAAWKKGPETRLDI